MGRVAGTDRWSRQLALVLALTPLVLLASATAGPSPDAGATVATHSG